MIESDHQLSLQSSLLSEYLKPHELDMLQTHSQIVSFNSGDILLQQGKYSNGIYIILSGSVISTAKILGESTTNLETLGSGNFIGEISFIEKAPCSTSIVASSKVVSLLINKTYLDFIAAYHPETKYKILNAICKQVCSRLKMMHDKLIALISNTDMAERSFFSELINSFSKPTEIPINEMELSQLIKYPSLQNFHKDEIDLLSKHAVFLKAPKYCTLIHKGDKTPSFYIVVDGAVQSSIAHDNKIAKLSVIGPATLFAGIACIDENSPFTITFSTCEQSILLQFNEQVYISLQKEKPELWYKIFDLICRSIIALEKSVDKLDIRLNIETYNR